MRIIKNVEENRNMQAYTYVSKGKFELREKPKPTLMQERDAIVKVTLASICSSDLHIKHRTTGERSRGERKIWSSRNSTGI